MTDPRLHSKTRRRIERVIKDDRRRRHRRRKDAESMVDLFSKQTLLDDPPIDTDDLPATISG
jgi:hypothetical protein